VPVAVAVYQVPEGVAVSVKVIKAVEVGVMVAVGVLEVVGVEVLVRVAVNQVPLGVGVGVPVLEDKGVEVDEIVGVMVKTGLEVADGKGVFPFGVIGKAEKFWLQDTSKKTADPTKTNSDNNPRDRIILIPPK
jgi:hypothetical protein